MEEAEVKQLISLIESAQLQYEVDESGTVSIVCDPVQLIDSSSIQDEENTSHSSSNILVHDIQCAVSPERENLSHDGAGSSIILKKETRDDITLEEILTEKKVENENFQSDHIECDNAVIHQSSISHPSVNYLLQTTNGQIIQVLESVENAADATPQRNTQSFEDITVGDSFANESMQILVVGSCENGEIFLTDTTDDEMAETTRENIAVPQVMMRPLKGENRVDAILNEDTDIYITLPEDCANSSTVSTINDSDLKSKSYEKVVKFPAINNVAGQQFHQDIKDEESVDVPSDNTSYVRREASQNTSKLFVPYAAQSSSATLAEGSVVHTDKGKMKAFSLSCVTKEENADKKSSLHTIASSFGSWVKILKPVGQEREAKGVNIKEKFPIFSCGDCGTFLHSEWSLKIHRRRYHEEWMDECFICGEKFLNLYYVRTHIREVHSQENSFSCRYCSFKCSLIKEFYKHFKVHVKLQICKNCGKKYMSPKLFQDHVSSCQEKESADYNLLNEASFTQPIKLIKDLDGERDMNYKNDLEELPNQVKMAKNKKTDGEYKIESIYFSQQIKKMALESLPRNSGRGRFRTHRCYLCFKCFSSTSELEKHKEVYHRTKSSQPVRVKTDESLGKDEDDVIKLAARMNAPHCFDEDVEIKSEPLELEENMEDVTIDLDDCMNLKNVIKPMCIACNTYTKTDYRQSCKLFEKISDCDQLEALRSFEKFFPCILNTESVVEPWVLCKKCASLINKITDLEEVLADMKNCLLLRLQGNALSSDEPVRKHILDLPTVKKEDSENMSTNTNNTLSSSSFSHITEKSLADVESFMKKNCEIMEVLQPKRKSGRPRKDKVEKLAPVLLSDEETEAVSNTDSPKQDTVLDKNNTDAEEGCKEGGDKTGVKIENPDVKVDRLHDADTVFVKTEPFHRESETSVTDRESLSWQEDLDESSMKSVKTLTDEDFLIPSCKTKNTSELETDVFTSKLLPAFEFSCSNSLREDNLENVKTINNENKTREESSLSGSSENFCISSFTSKILEKNEVKDDVLSTQVKVGEMSEPLDNKIESEICIEFVKDSQDVKNSSIPSKDSVTLNDTAKATYKEKVTSLKTLEKRKFKGQDEKRLMSYQVTGTATKPWRCSNCHKAFSSQRGACDHYAAFHGGQGFTCEHCQASYVRKRDLIGHYNEVHLNAKPYKCKKCEASFSMHSQLYRHMGTAHMKVKNTSNFECHLCGASFTQKRYRDAHIAVCSTKGVDYAPHRCPHCDKSFKLMKYLRIHIKSVHFAKSLYFLCEICNKILNDKRNLILHMKSHTGETETSCKVCNKTFSRKSYLWAHMRVHTDERPYGCNYCTKWFKQYSTWKNHERTHTGEKPYKCSHCNALFSTRSSVSKHIQYAHYHIRDHVCSVCDKRFISKAKLSDHTKTHTGERPYECPICSRAFSRKSNLRYHMYTHSENKRFRCELCQEGFMRRSAVENHILDRHGNVEVMIGSSPSDPNKCKTENEMLTATENEMLTATAPFITVIDADDMTGEDTYIVVYADEGREMDVTDELQNNLQDATSNNQVPVSIIHTPVRRAATMSISNISTQSSGSSRYSSSANEEVLSIENDETSSHLGIHVSEDI